jgi:hypothetical protein
MSKGGSKKQKHKRKHVNKKEEEETNIESASNFILEKDRKLNKLLSFLSKDKKSKYEEEFEEEVLELPEEEQLTPDVTSSEEVDSQQLTLDVQFFEKDFIFKEDNLNVELDSLLKTVVDQPQSFVGSSTDLSAHLRLLLKGLYGYGKHVQVCDQLTYYYFSQTC